MEKIISILAFSMTFLAIPYGQPSDDYAKTLKEMFKVSGSEETYKAAIKQIIDIYKQQEVNVDPAVWEELEKEFSKTSIDDLGDMLTPVYVKYMALEDLQEMINFYQTPVGQKFAKSTRLIMQESMQIGQQWGMILGQQITKKLEEKGY